MKVPSLKYGIISAPTRSFACSGVHPPVGRAGGEDFDEGEPFAFDLVAERLFDRLAGLQDVLRRVDRHPRRVADPFEAGEQLGHADRIAVVADVAPFGRGRGALPRQGGRRHLAAGHAVGGVVDEDHRHRLAAVGGVDDLAGADGRQIAVPLIGEDDSGRGAPA